MSPVGVMMRGSHRCLVLTRERDQLAMKAQMLSLSRSQLMLPVLRSWLLVVAELGAARLPGGDLVEADNAGGLIRPLDATDVHPWQLAVRQTLTHAVDRDGEALYEVMNRTLRSGGAVPYLTAIAGVTARMIDALALPAEAVNAAHLLGYFCRQPFNYSVAGVGLRLITGTHQVLDMGQSFAETIIGPELDALATLDPMQCACLLAVMGPAFGSVINDDDEFAVHGLSGRPGEQERAQVRGARLGMAIAKAYRADPVTVRNLGETLNVAELPLAVFGLGNMLAVRSRELWGT